VMGTFKLDSRWRYGLSEKMSFEPGSQKLYTVQDMPLLRSGISCGQ
jgi:hypothetical protein